jgi:hypothetical protein
MFFQYYVPVYNYTYRVIIPPTLSTNPWKQYFFFLCFLLDSVTTLEQNRIQGGWPNSDPCTLTIFDPLVSPYIHSSSPTPELKWSILLTEMSSGNCSIQCQPRCLNLNVAKVSESQRIRKAISDACLHLSHSGLFTSPCLNRCPFKWQYPAKGPVIILGWCMFTLSNFPAI